MFNDVFGGCCALYPARRLSARDADAVLKLYEGNPQYFAAMHSPATRESVLDDLTALPPGKTAEDKSFLGFYDGDALVAVMDWIAGYPDGRTAFIGLFMVDAAYQGKGVGSTIVRDCLDWFARLGFERARLGYVETNPQSEAFWKKNGFVPTGERSGRGGYAVVVAQRALCFCNGAAQKVVDAPAKL